MTCRRKLRASVSGKSPITAHLKKPTWISARSNRNELLQGSGCKQKGAKGAKGSLACSHVRKL